MLEVPTPKQEEQGSKFGDDVYNPLSVGMPGAEQLKEEELARAQKASIDTALEEQAAWEDSGFFEHLPGIY